MNIRQAIGAAILLTGAAWAQSASASTVVFSDDFNSYSPSLNWTPSANWTAPLPGAVDLIGTGTSWDYFPGNGYNVDLNGTNGVAGTLTTTKIFAAGTYTLTFNLGGNTVGPANGDFTDKTTNVSLGDWSAAPIVLPYNAGFTSQSFSFTTKVAGALSFSEPSQSPAWPDNYIGNILDNVTVSAVPEPATWAMLLIGFGAVGFAMRGARKQAGAAAIA